MIIVYTPEKLSQLDRVSYRGMMSRLWLTQRGGDGRRWINFDKPHRDRVTTYLARDLLGPVGRLHRPSRLYDAKRL